MSRVLASVICFMAVALSLVAVDAPPRELVAKAAANYEARKAVAVNFTYQESFRNQNFNSSGKRTLDVSDTFDVLVLEGAPYFRHTGHNGAPLSSREDRKEQEKLTQVTAARRAGNRSAGIYPHGLSIAFPIADLADHFDLHLAGEETMDGKKTYLIDAVPSASFLASPSASAFAKAMRLRLWIDEQDLQFAQIRAEIVRPGTQYQPGSVIDADFRKVNEQAWLMSRFHFKGNVVDGSHLLLVEAEQQCYNYRKFSVESTLVSQ